MENQIQNTNKFVDLLLIIFATWAIPELSSILTNLVYPPFQHFDPDEVFLWLTIHHVIQLALTIMAMWMLVKNWDLKQWGFNFKNWENSLLWIGGFLTVLFISEYLRISNNGLDQFDFPYTTKNQIGKQFFQYFLSGLGEEPLFRGLIMVFLAKHWNKVFTIFKIEFPITILIATILFMIAHLPINVWDLSIGEINYSQQWLALEMGIIYGVVFHYTKSLLAPIAMHGLSNGIKFSLSFYL